jgi:predicted transcriptional regulator
MSTLTAPAGITVIPGSRMDLLLRWYLEHRGYHRCMDVASAVGLPTQRVAVVTRRLFEKDAVDRREVRVSGRQTPVVLYGIPGE